MKKIALDTFMDFRTMPLLYRHPVFISQVYHRQHQFAGSVFQSVHPEKKGTMPSTIPFLNLFLIAA